MALNQNVKCKTRAKCNLAVATDERKYGGYIRGWSKCWHWWLNWSKIDGVTHSCCCYGSFWPKESLIDDDENVEKDKEVSDNYFFWFFRSWQLYIPDTD